jgi:DNA invertase Pin-like site-specific DNA recombinase
VLRDADKHSFDALWVIDKSRLSRSPGTTEVVLAQFAKLKIELHTGQGLVSIGSAESAFINIIEAAADLLSSTRSKERALQAFETMLARGEHAFGRGPWGRIWDKTAKAWSVDLEAKRQARQLYRMCVERGFGTIEIGRRLGWHQNTVGKRLHSAGLSKWPRRLGEKTYILNIPPLLTPMQAAAIERRLKANLSIMPQNKHRSLLQGMIRCANCGGNLSHATSGDRQYAYYTHLPSSRRQGCIAQVPAPLIERDVVACCGELLASSAKLKAGIEAALKDASGDLKDAKAEITDVQAEISKLEVAHQRCLDALVFFNHSERERAKLADAAKGISARLESLKGTHEALRVRLGKSSEQEPAKIASQMRRLFGLRGLAVLSLPKEKQRELVSLVVGRASKESPEGIYVKNAGMAGGRPAAWEWRLQGSLGLLDGTASHLIALQHDGRNQGLRPDSATSGTAERFGKQLTPLLSM